MSDSTDRVRTLISRLVDAQKAYTSQAFDKEESGAPRPPATPEQIANLERRFTRALPSSLRAFLSVCNGFDRFHADGVLFGTEDYEMPWVARRLARLDKNWPDVEPNPFGNKALPLMMGPDIPHFVVISHDRVNQDGEPLLVEYELGAEVRTYPDLYALLEKELATLKGMLDRRRNAT